MGLMEWELRLARPRIPTQRTTGRTPMKAKTSQPWRPVDKRKDKDKSAPHESTRSGSDSESSDDVDDDSSNHAIWPTQKRKRSLPAKQHGQTLSMTLKQCPQHAKLVAKRRKPFSPGHPPCNGLPVQDRHRDVYTLHREDNCKEYDHVSRQVRSNKRLKPTGHSRQSKEHKRKRAHGGIDNGEYEVAQILEARLHYRKLQYRAKWSGYGPDPVWYAASNFKRSPYKLRMPRPVRVFCRPKV
ncbi:hypothetical protein DM02DRAFT_368141 [Periconia macrospinosa]|uniref:Chromo domain-containing protein n=1 Tax=Periconia macrospinosa TaxID=97972 RepID=A0A2V1CZE8_9PLEO|nr:hypothetical protein DM02DRAFT_368141 [Periconia macrospinosa]